jgi:hypothetical protein
VIRDQESTPALPLVDALSCGRSSESGCGGSASSSSSSGPDGHTSLHLFSQAPRLVVVTPSDLFLFPMSRILPDLRLPDDSSHRRNSPTPARMYRSTSAAPCRPRTPLQ